MKIVKSWEKIEERVCEDRISELPEDLLIKILWYVPTKVAVATMFLSKRWLYVWTMMIKFEYKDSDVDYDYDYDYDYDGDDGEEEEEDNDEDSEDNVDEDESKKKSVWWFLEKSLQLHKAPVIHILSMELGPRCPTDFDIGKWVAKAVESRRVIELTLKLLWSAPPVRLPKSLYTCRSLYDLTLSNKILVDLPSSLSLPSLKILKLYYVVYKDEDSLVRLLSSFPLLKLLSVRRKKNDNLKKFTVKVPSLWCLGYINRYKSDVGDTSRCLVINTPALEIFIFLDSSGDYCSIGSMPCLNNATFKVKSYPCGARFLTSLSSVLSLSLSFTDEVLACCGVIKFKFSRLIKLEIYLHELDWLEPLMRLLANSPKLKKIVLYSEFFKELSWNQPSCVPGCLSSQLEIFEWDGFGYQVEEEEFLKYILTNSKCLKTARIPLSSTFDLEDQDLIIQKLKEIPRVSIASQLLFK